MRRIGLISGSGEFPIKFAEEVKRLGNFIVSAAHVLETDPRIEGIVDDLLWIKVGELSKTIRFFKKHNINEVAMLGGITRVRLFKNFFPDVRVLSLFARARSLKDDKVLRLICGEFEKEGFTMINPSEFLTSYLARKGTVTRRELTAYEKAQALIGFDAAKILGSIDCGQTAVACSGTILALECVEGTDKTILRAGEVGANDSLSSKNEGGVVVKLSKSIQDLRFDLPAVGIRTLENMKRSGCTALVLENERALIQDPEQFRIKANEFDIAVEIW